ncbi:hypothetical protein AsFPU1_3133 [Aphanothece sacrum FPU1]|uniref:SPOR domain-containing protein n=2 Tax=Aphanothece sacrum TaxID=1122 RepID=A0A401IK91_APHSA|nr:hypothetical protein AsFPU1_3133 [Aphanothece sacrum FPU1]GBF85071.1 hypothetical protein AsFPU3_2128 [Aphanothece sacrum FPU3]
MAQSVSQTKLPAPPTLAVPKTSVSAPVKASPVIPKVSHPTSDNKLSQGSTSVREYTFQAPQTISPELPTPEVENTPPVVVSETPSVSQKPLSTTDKPGLYRVEVRGKQESVLAKVKAVEPLAFIRQQEGVIHAGMFQNAQQAQQRVEQLGQKGISAKVVSVSQDHTNDLTMQMGHTH